MAKRFTDSEKYNRPWFRELPNDEKSLWDYLCATCDHAGIWVEDYKRIQFCLNLDVDSAALERAFGSKLIRVDEDKFFIRSFVEFQYGLSADRKLNPGSSVHLGVIRLLQRYGIDPVFLIPAQRFPVLDETLTQPLGNGSVTIKNKDQDKAQDKNQDKGFKTSAASEDFKPYEPKSKFSLERADIDLCAEVWRGTLQHFKMDRTLLESEVFQIAQAIQRKKSHKAVAFALEGARFEPKDDRYNPADFLSLSRILDAEKFDRFMNLGVAEEHRRRKKGA